MKQVNYDHYAFDRYEAPERFTSYYYQVHAALHFMPTSLLEVGTGSGVFAALTHLRGIHTFTLDIDPDLHPSVAGSVLQLPFKDGAVDACAAFEILEHLPFEHFSPAIAELERVARKGVVISLPEFGNAAISASIPFVRHIRFSARALPWHPKHRFDGEHYWEINKRDYRLHTVIDAMTANGLSLVDSWRNPYNPYHHFFVLRKSD